VSHQTACAEVLVTGSSASRVSSVAFADLERRPAAMAARRVEREQPSADVRVPPGDSRSTSRGRRRGINIHHRADGCDLRRDERLQRFGRGRDIGA
jgi:hypothetical protein